MNNFWIKSRMKTNICNLKININLTNALIKIQYKICNKVNIYKTFRNINRINWYNNNFISSFRTSSWPLNKLFKSSSCFKIKKKASKNFKLKLRYKTLFKSLWINNKLIEIILEPNRLCNRITITWKIRTKMKNIFHKAIFYRIFKIKNKNQDLIWMEVSQIEFIIFYLDNFRSRERFQRDN